MKKTFTIIFLSVFCISQTFAITTEQKKDITKSLTNDCKDVQESDIPTIFIPGIAASWYSQEGFKESKVKRWIPDPVSHVYDTLFYTFKQTGYSIKNVFYEDEFTLKIEGNPKGGFYLFGYDWKKDNRITATLLTQLIGLIYKKYEEENHGCKLTRVNIVAHSMGGLVVRSMLEDMCIGFKKEGNYFTFDAFPKKDSMINGVVNGKIKDFRDYIVSCTNPINPNQPIKVNKFITIGTPHRGSPKSFSLWEAGDIELTDGIEFDMVIKSQILGKLSSNKELFKAVHGYNTDLPNGIVTVGQLLPDITNENPYNNKLLYLNVEEGFKREHYPKNSFLEELNKSENINKIWDKLTGKFISYYSNVTGSNGTNNIIGFRLGNTQQVKVNSGPVSTTITYKYIDNSLTQTGLDIYGFHDSEKFTQALKADGLFNSIITASLPYSISEVIRNETGLGGDGTVPSFNGRLVPNDSTTGEEVVNPKFESREVKCYQENRKGEIGHQNNKTIQPNPSFLGIGNTNEQAFQVCQHTNLAIATSQRVVRDILGMDPLKPREENTLLWQSIGYARYVNNSWGILSSILNTDNLSNYFSSSKYIFPNDKVDGQQIIPLNFTEGALGGGKNLLRYDILSPINVLITDEQGRRIGIDPDTGKIINEIPGAWTSGDTAGSNEPEFFLIPDTLSGKLTHKIETFGTGDGVYHIEMREIAMNSTGGQENNGITKLLTIAGNTKEGFGQEYKVIESQTGTTQGTPTFSFTNISDYPAKIETQLDTYVTLQDTFTLRYSVKGDGKNVAKIQVETTDSKGTKTTNSYTINGEIPLTLKEIGNTKVTLTLLDKGGKPLTYDGAKKVMTIKKIENIAKQSLIISGATLSQKSLDLYEKNKAKRSLFDFSSFFK